MHIVIFSIVVAYFMAHRRLYDVDKFGPKDF